MFSLVIFLLILTTFCSNFYFDSATFPSAAIKNVPTAHSKLNLASAHGIFGQPGNINKSRPQANLSMQTEMNLPSISINTNGQHFFKPVKRKYLIKTKAKANSAPDESDSEWYPPGFGIGWQFPNQWSMRKNQPKSGEEAERSHIGKGNEEKRKNNKMDEDDEEKGRMLAKQFNEELIMRQRKKELERRSVSILEGFMLKMRSGMKSAKNFYAEHPKFLDEDLEHLNPILDLLLFYGDLDKDEQIVNKHAIDAAFARAILYLLNRNHVFCKEVDKLRNERVNGKSGLIVAENILENYTYWPGHWPNFVKQVEWLNWHNLGGQNFVENLQRMAEIFENALKFYEIDLLWDKIEKNWKIFDDIEETKNQLKSTEKFLLNLAKIVKVTDELNTKKKEKITPEIFKQLLESIGHCLEEDEENFGDIF